MKSRILAALFAALFAVPSIAAEREIKHAGSSAPIGWLNLRSGSRKFSVSEEDLQKVIRELPQGELVPVFQTKEKHGIRLAHAGALNLATGKTEMGWVEVKPENLDPPQTYPLDSELLQSLGGAYLDDFTAGHSDIARFLVRQAHGPALLLCYVLTAPLSMAKLVIFTPSQGKYQPQASLNIAITDIEAGIISLEIRNLAGDDSDFIITKETFRDQAQTFGTNMLIRTITNGQFRVVWQAPIEFRNLSEYSSKMQIFEPPEKNIGAPGTVTTGKVSFRSNGKWQEPVWDGKVDFFIFGREKPIDFVKIEKVCPWSGTEFTPLR